MTRTERARLLGEDEAYLLDLADGPIPPPEPALLEVAALLEDGGDRDHANLVRPNPYFLPPSRVYLTVVAAGVSRERDRMYRAAPEVVRRGRAA